MEEVGDVNILIVRKVLNIVDIVMHMVEESGVVNVAVSELCQFKACAHIMQFLTIKMYHRYHTRKKIDFKFTLNSLQFVRFN